ncbi:type I-G CRISPR-associated protein, Cas3-extension family [Stratiformator vulcanicus]|uniref:Uncharacterized protein n=1 Tax=Stratiformator vulcanicus TaxID=2527980 RepID=A0A517QWJ3_9PLAN|nr:hypothetical protein [Stratiformator vulcanicus]QDT36036.1 hypothetical protein Pan189_03910 [Stratiformator vulcanicus]
MTATQTAEPSEGLLLPGLDGTNPLGFLAAVGLLRVVSEIGARDMVRLCWESARGTWLPRLTGHGIASVDFPNVVTDQLKNMPRDCWVIDKKLPFDRLKFREHLIKKQHAASGESRVAADLLAALGVDIASKGGSAFIDTALRMVRSGDAQGQGFLHYAHEIIQQATLEEVRHALFERWVFRPAGSPLRLAPEEAKSYAYRADDPKTEKPESVRGANFLALVGLPFFPIVPRPSSAATVGFRKTAKRNDPAFVWPIWNRPLSASLVKSLLTLSWPTTDDGRREATERGISAVYQSDQFRPSTYYKNFTPARRIV